LGTHSKKDSLALIETEQAAYIGGTKDTVGKLEWKN
jgi:hypothetical protein